MTNYYYYYGVTLQNLSIDNILNVSNISIIKNLLPPSWRRARDVRPGDQLLLPHGLASLRPLPEAGPAGLTGVDKSGHLLLYILHGSIKPLKLKLLALL